MTKSTNGNVKLELSEWRKIALGLFIGVMLPGAGTALALYVQVQQLQTAIDEKGESIDQRFDSVDNRIDDVKQDVRELRGRH